MTRPLFLGRQPILDRQRQIVAYELLFRDGEVAQANVVDDTAATARVIQYAFSELGVQAVLGQLQGYINVSTDMLLSDAIECLPEEQIVIELLETLRVDDEVVARCAALKALGYRFALDDFVYDSRFDPLLELVDVVKVDLTLHDAAALEAVVAHLRGWPVRLLAEKVDSAEQAERCHALGFDLFQGYYFARPSVLTGQRARAVHAALTHLVTLVINDADSREIQDVFKRHPDLTLKLLRLVNTSASALNRPLATISDALYVLGRAPLRRWLLILLYALDDSTRYPGPLLQVAATRGRMMERLAELRRCDSRTVGEAFMVGILSLIDSLVGRPIAELVEEFDLAQPISDALLQRTGELGLLLRLAECVERPDLSTTLALTRQAGLSLTELTSASIDAMLWVNQVINSQEN